MKRLMAAAALVLMAACDRAPTGPSFAASNPASSGNKLQCFADAPATCALTRDGATVTVTTGADAGVYVFNTNLGGKSLSSLNKLSFSWTGGPVSGGTPRFSIPIDEVAGSTDTPLYAFIDTTGCPVTGVIDAFQCTVFYRDASYAGWAAFAAANPAYVFSNDPPFVIADQPGTFTFSNVQIGRGAAKAK